MDLTRLQPCDIILFEGSSFISRGIEWFTNSKWSHVAIYVGGGGNYVIEATEAGVEKNDLLPLLQKARSFQIRRLEGLTVEQAELIKAQAYSLIYKGYDFTQILSMGIYFGIRKLFGKAPKFLVANSRNKMICSELIAVCYQCLPLKFARDTKLVTPDTLGETDKLVTIDIGRKN